MEKYNEMDLSEYYSKHRANYIGSYIYRPMSGIWTHLYWTDDKAHIKELETKDYENVSVMSTGLDISYIEIISPY